MKRHPSDCSTNDVATLFEDLHGIFFWWFYFFDRDILGHVFVTSFERSIISISFCYAVRVYISFGNAFGNAWIQQYHMTSAIMIVVFDESSEVRS